MKNLNFQSVKNIRDFGGIINKEGKTIRPGLFIRSATLYGLSDDDVAQFSEAFHLTKVIDLRTDQEREEKPDTWIPGCVGYHFSLLKGSVTGISHEKETDDGVEQLNAKAQKANEKPKTDVNHLSTREKREREKAQIPEMAGLYRALAVSEHTHRMLTNVFAEICGIRDYVEEAQSAASKSCDGKQTSATKAVLWHCTEGKDRCGIVSALFLYLLDVDEKVIMEDYLYTNKVNQPKALRTFLLILLFRRNLQMARSVYRVYIADRTYLQSFLDAVKENYGSIDDFMRNQLGVTDERKKALKDYCLR